jgi:antitoxin component YwqK of YwqJK toxin-antitoxin module
MKRILAPILLLTLLFPALAFGETIDDLVITNGLYYKKYTVVPFTGNITGKSHGSFRNGKKHGPWVSYHDNGQVFSQGTYKNDKEDGPWVVYYKNGQLLSKGTLKDGKMDGPWVGYNDDGTVWEKYTGTF